MKNILIIGAGLSSCVIARELKDNGFNCTIIEKRNHIGGNCYDYINEYGINIHKYGPHLFHTNKKYIFDWLSKFTEWVEYKHKVKAMLNDGKLVVLPVNIETKNIVGEENIIDIFFRPYTKKMWNKEIEELDKEILNRVPIRNDNNELYFPNDEYQFMPKYGYTKMFEKILDGIQVFLKIDFKKYGISMEKNYDFIFNSMPIDEYYNYCYGELEYRSIKFKNINLPIPKLFPVATINFTHNGPETRITEWKNIPNHGNNNKLTSLTIEEPCDFKDNNYERYYPVKDIDNKNLNIYNKYNKIKNDKMIFIGRCGKYKYMNMDEVIEDSLNIAKNFIINNLK